MPEYIYDDHPEWEGMSPQQLPDWYNKGYASQEDYLLKTTGSPTPTVTAIPNNQLEGLSSQQILPPQQALLTPEQQSIVQNTDQQVAWQNTPTPQTTQPVAPTPVQQPVTPTPAPTPTPTGTATTTPTAQVPTGMAETPANLAAMTWDQRMEYFRQNPDVAASELERATNNAWYLSSQGQEAPDQLRYIQAIQSLKGGTLTQQPPVAEDVGTGTGADTGTGTGAGDGTGTGVGTGTGEFKSQYSDDITSRLDALEQMMNKPVDITQSPFYQSMMQLAEQNGNIAAQRTMEQLNARGILNSTITAYNVAQAKQQAIVQVMPQILQQAYNLRQDEIDNIMDQVNQYIKLDQEDYDRYLTGEEAKAKKELREYERAWDRSEATGFISNDDAIILGVAPGPTFQYSKWMAEEIYKQQKYVDDLAMEREKLKLDQAEYDERVRSNKASEVLASRRISSSASSSSTPKGVSTADVAAIGMSMDDIAAIAKIANVTPAQAADSLRNVVTVTKNIEADISVIETGRMPEFTEEDKKSGYITWLDKLRDAVDLIWDDLVIAGINPDEYYAQYESRVNNAQRRGV